ncbi:MAG: nucleotide exchange factor GrpE [bacterium]|nr:nucleotide exchange factor GrpE [bacterium]
MNKKARKNKVKDEDAIVSDELDAAKEDISESETGEAPEGTIDELAELQKRVDELEKEKNELKDQALRTHAEAENFKKRLTREKEDFAKYSNEKAVKEILPVIDNLERAVDHAKEAGESGGLIEGVEMTLNLFQKALERLGVSPVEAVGETFDPERHEAVQQIESTDHEPNIVVSEFQKGYMLHERLIRPAMVVVSSQSSKK